MTRRRLLQLLGVAAAGASLSGCRSLEQRLTQADLPSDALAPPSVPPRPAVRLLNRIAYGPRPGDIARVEKMGVAAFVDEQLTPDKVKEDPAATWRVRRLNDTLNADAGLLFDQDDKRVIAALRQATVLRAVYSRRQLQERMVEFWGDHFNVYAFKGSGPQLKVMDDRETIRNHALGQFGDLLKASAQSAAMLGYLDNAANRKGVPNENYARELMELHTLGINEGYSQRDVKEVARCLTGWTSERRWHRGRFHFDAATHDEGAKRVLGVTIPADGGVTDGERVLDILAAHPATARHVSRKLCVHFLGDAPASWVNRLSQIYLTTNGDIAALLRPLLTSPDLLTARPILKRSVRLRRQRAARLSRRHRRRQAGSRPSGSDGPAAVRLADAGRLSRKGFVLDRRIAAALELRRRADPEPLGRHPAGFRRARRRRSPTPFVPARHASGTGLRRPVGCARIVRSACPSIVAS